MIDGGEAKSNLACREEGKLFHNLHVRHLADSIFEDCKQSAVQVFINYLVSPFIVADCSVTFKRHKHHY